MNKAYMVLTTIRGFIPAKEGEPIPVILSEQFLERCAVKKGDYDRLHRMTFEVDATNTCIQASVPVSGGRELVYFAMSPEEIPELADAIVAHLIPMRQKLRLVKDGV